MDNSSQDVNEIRLIRDFFNIFLLLKAQLQERYKQLHS